MESLKTATSQARGPLLILILCLLLALLPQARRMAPTLPHTHERVQQAAPDHQEVAP